MTMTTPENRRRLSLALAVARRGLSADETAAFGSAEDMVAALTQVERTILAGGPAAAPAEHPTRRLEVPPDSVPPAASARQLQIGMVLGRVTLLERIGRGGFAVVYRGVHQTLNIPVAIKVIKSERLAADPFALDKFRAEAQVLAQFNHPNVVRVLDFDDSPAMPYIVMEFVEGLSLAELIEQCGRLRVDRALQVARQAACGLLAGQRAGLVHRDIKPANILLSREGPAKLSDYGLATLRAIDGSATPSSPSQVTHDLVGTVAFMAPEHADSDEADFRSDIYSLGVTLYQAITGQLPFTGQTAMEVMIKHANEPPIPPIELQPDLRPAVDSLVRRMLAKRPGDRHGSLEQLIGEIDGCLHETAVRLQRVPTPAGVGAATETSSGRSFWQGWLGLGRKGQGDAP